MSNHNGILRGMGVALFIGGLLILDLWIADLSSHGLLIASIIFALSVPIGLRFTTGRLDLFEPLVSASIALGVMFIGRPLADLATGNTLHLDYSVIPTFDKTLVVILVGIVTFQIGYHSPFPEKWARCLRRPPIYLPRRTAISGWVFFIIGGALFTVFLEQGGGFDLLAILLSGRSTEDNSIFLGSSGYFYNGILFWSASALIFFALAITVKWHRYYFYFVVVVLPLIIFYGARGTRSQLFPLVLAVPIFWYLWKGRRPSSRVLFVAIVVGIVLISWQREIRTAGSTVRQETINMLISAFSTPVEQAADILTGADNEMFDSLANELQVVPDKLGYRPFGSITDLLIRAVPRPIWPNKSLETNDAVVNTLWPSHYAQSHASSAFSVLGPFYADSGFIGVGLGMFFIGVALATSWKWFLRYRTNVVALLIYSMGLPFVVILMRGTLPDTLTRMLFMVIPLVMLVWILRVRFMPADNHISSQTTLLNSGNK